MKSDVIILYSHKDLIFLTELRYYLENSSSSEHFKFWHDKDITPGTKWLNIIREKLQNAKIAILLVSSNYLSSQFCILKEIPLILKMNRISDLKILPILLNECNWRDFEWLKHLQMFPNGKITIEQDYKSNKEILFDRISKTLIKLQTKNGDRKKKQLFKPFHNLPELSNLEFIGREEIIQEIYDILNSNYGEFWTQPRIALTGIAGIGKSQIALQYAYHHMKTYKGALWFDCTTNDITSSFSSIARLLSLNKNTTKHSIEIEQVINEIQRNGPYLLIYDNVTDIEGIKFYLPKTGNSHILITTNNNTIANVHQIVVPPLPLTYAMWFLLGEHNSEDRNLEETKELAEELGRIPLYLTIAKQILKNSSWTPLILLDLIRKEGIQKFIDEFESYLPEDLKKKSKIKQLLLTSIQCLNESSVVDRIALSMLKCAGFLENHVIPRQLLSVCSDYLDNRDKVEDVKYRHAIARLATIGFTIINDPDKIKFHYIVQSFGKYLGGVEAEHAVKKALNGVALYYLYHIFTVDYEEVELYLPHLEKVSQSENYSVKEEMGITSFLADYYAFKTNWNKKLSGVTVWSSHPDFLFYYYCDMAKEYIQSGSNSLAWIYINRAITQTRKKTNLSPAEIVNRLFSVGRCAMGEKDNEEQLYLYEFLHDTLLKNGLKNHQHSEDINTAVGNILLKLDKTEFAIPYLIKDAQNATKASPVVPDEIFFSNLQVSNAYYQLGKHEESKKYAERCIEVLEKIHENDPITLADEFYLKARILYNKKYIGFARFLCEKSLSIYKTKLGESHLKTAKAKAELGRNLMYYRLPQAISLIKEAIDILEEDCDDQAFTEDVKEWLNYAKKVC